LIGRAEEPAPTRRPLLAFQSALVLLVFAGCLVYGSWRLGQADFPPGPRIALLQSNEPQQFRNDPVKAAKEKAAGTVFSVAAELHSQAVVRRPALIVWPETSWPGNWDSFSADEERGLLSSSQQQLRLTARQ